MKHLHLLIVLAALTLASCASVDRMIDRGDFDAALSKAARKLEGKKNLKTKYVQALEEAFVQVIQRDMNRVKSLHSSVRSHDHKSILEIYDRIAYRQERIKPFLPLTSVDGYQARFQFVHVEPLATETENTFVRLLKTEAITALEEGRRGDKRASRDAYYKLSELLSVRPSSGVRDLRREAEDLGTVKINVEIANRTRYLIPQTLQRQIITGSLPDNRWLSFSTGVSGKHHDFELAIVLNALEATPEQLREKVVERSTEIEAGFDYVLDDNGNVLKDSLGNDVKVPRFEEVTARVITVAQFKSVILAGEIVCRNLSTNAVDYLPIQSEVVFDHVFSKYQGDRRALLPQDRELLDVAFLPFPSNEIMFDDAVRRISPAIKDKVRESAFL